MSNEDATLWTAVLPVLPLERGVPVFQQIGEGIAAGVAMSSTWIAWESAFGKMYGETEKARVDLNHHQGFAYALRVYYSKTGVDTPVRMNPRGALAHRALMGQTTDADRLALAKALREVIGA